MRDTLTIRCPAVAWLCWVIGCLALVAPPVQAQEIITPYQFAIGGQRVVFDAIDPVIRKWYLPQDLYRQYKWRGWEYSNYARTLYQRYTDIELEGERWYDIYGNYLTRGWQVFDWRQEQPLSFGSAILKQPQFSSWFNNLVIASDAKGQHYTTVTIGNEIRTTLTPLTFSKPAYSGLQWDYLSDKYALTVLASRVNSPGYAQTKDLVYDETDFTNLLAFRGTVQVGDFVNLGATYVNTQIGRTDRKLTGGDVRKGQLSTVQNGDVVRWVAIRISDDSPEDGRAGGAYFTSTLYTRRVDADGAVIKEWGPEEGVPLIEGGFQRRGYLAADGAETITLTYNITDPGLVDRIGFDLVLSNDYRVEVTSNQQSNAQGFPVYLPVARATRNVDDNSNQQVVRFEYGLPTGNEICGLTLEMQDVLGFSLRAEYDTNLRHRRFPNVNFTDHRASTDQAQAFYATATKLAYPWFVYAEAFSLDADYNTTVFMVDPAGVVDYGDEVRYLYELVDDNDDQDRLPDWSRQNQRRDDNGVFPGLDENNDYRSDYNQNDNVRPDYEEPFLRYAVDPPEFLFGMDMNHNTVVDRFEDDEEPDFPYKRDHRGYNGYVGLEVAPHSKLRVGRTREWLWSDDRESRATYALLTVNRDYPRLGKIQLFEHLQVVKDDVPDDVWLWTQPRGTKGGRQLFRDPLQARDTFINTAYLGFDYAGVRRLMSAHKIKYEVYNQRHHEVPVWVDGKADTLRTEDSWSLGVVNKIDYSFPILDVITITPKAKSMYRQLRTGGQSSVSELTEAQFLVVRFPVLNRSQVELGVEVTQFWDFNDKYNDFDGLVLAGQFANRTAYLGYELTTNIGIEYERRVYIRRVERSTVAYVSVYAGLGG
ncbi:MAG: hypothetical protein ABIL09_07715 [Gemmatimonadota bacterium]